MSSRSIESLVGSLQSHELRMKQFNYSPLEQAFQSQLSFEGGARGKRGGHSRGRGRSSHGCGTYEKNEKESESHRNNAPTRGRGRGQGRGRGHGSPHSHIQCHYCKKYGHMQAYCRKKMADEGQNESRFTNENVQEKEGNETVSLACNVSENVCGDIWYLDSGCSNHMTGNRDVFINLDNFIQSEVKIGDDRRLPAKGCGDVLLRTKKGDQKRISNVLNHNLLSVGQLLRNGHDVHFKGDHCIIRDKNNSLITKVRMSPNNMFGLNIQYESLPCFSAIIKNSSWLWHLRFGHLSFSSLSLMCKKHMVRGMPNIDHQDQVCEGCALGKHHS